MRRTEEIDQKKRKPRRQHHLREEETQKKVLLWTQLVRKQVRWKKMRLAQMEPSMKLLIRH
jgi:hypothetical protein